jgi:hypothetical protein
MSYRNVQVVNVAMTTGTDEYSVVIPTGAIEVQIKLQDATHTCEVYQVSVGNGGSPANFWTIDAGQVWYLGSTKQDQQTLYLMSATSSVVAEVSYYLDQ